MVKKFWLSECRGKVYFDYAEPTNEASAEAKFTLIMPCKEEEDKVNVKN